MPYIGTISTYESGVDVFFEWKLENFFTLSVSDGAYYWSPNFSFGGEKWYLYIYPNGSSGRVSSRHVDLELCKFISDRSIKQSFSLSIKAVTGEKYNEKHCTKNFDNNNTNHPFNRFISRSDLRRRRCELLPEGFLMVVCTMKRSTSAGSATGNVSEYAYVRASPQLVGASAHHVGASTHHVGASAQSVETSTQRVGASSQCEGASNQRVESSNQHVGASAQTVEASTQTVEEKYEATTSESSTNSQEKKALQDFKELFLKKEECDVTIRVRGSELLAHRLILKARSPVLASTFRHDMRESATGVLEIDDCDPSSFSDFLCFIYCADVQIITQENVFDLFTLADKYQVLELRSKCLDFMKKNLTVDTFCETITLALLHSETELIKLCTDYFKKNAPKIILTVKWQMFLAENPTESNELLIKLLVPNSS